MGSRLALMATIAALAVASPALAQVVIDGKNVGAEPQAGPEYGPVPADEATGAAPKEVPAPPPPGCPYRDRKLELIV